MLNRYSEVHRCKDASQNRIFPTASDLVPATSTTPHRAGRLDVGGLDQISDFKYNKKLRLADWTPRCAPSVGFTLVGLTQRLFVRSFNLELEVG